MQKACNTNKMKCMLQLPLHFKGLASADVELRVGLLWGLLHFIVWVGWRMEVRTSYYSTLDLIIPAFCNT